MFIYLDASVIAYIWDCFSSRTGIKELIGKTKDLSSGPKCQNVHPELKHLLSHTSWIDKV
jgi:hypothetical protein